MKIGPHGMAGEIGVMFDIPQPFTIRSRTLTQVIRISHSHLLHTIRPGTADGETIFSNFVKVCTHAYSDYFYPGVVQTSET
jgi:hypothetical protein